MAIFSEMIASTISGRNASIETKVNSFNTHTHTIKSANIGKLPYACANTRSSKEGVAHRGMLLDKMASKSNGKRPKSASFPKNIDKLCQENRSRSLPKYMYNSSEHLQWTVDGFRADCSNSTVRLVKFSR